MLVPGLWRIKGTSYTPVPEYFRRGKNNVRGSSDSGIWDILGCYDPHLRLIVIYDESIEETAWDIASKLEIDSTYATAVLRELVRLHEHVHAYIHSAEVDYVAFSALTKLFSEEKGVSQNPNDVEWVDLYPQLPSQVVEPVVECICYGVLQQTRGDLILKVFEVADSTTPSYYQRWKDVRELAEKLSSRIAIVWSILLRVAPNKMWDDYVRILLKDKDALITATNLIYLFY